MKLKKIAIILMILSLLIVPINKIYAKETILVTDYQKAFQKNVYMYLYSNGMMQYKGLSSIPKDERVIVENVKKIGLDLGDSIVYLTNDNKLTLLGTYSSGTLESIVIDNVVDFDIVNYTLYYKDVNNNLYNLGNKLIASDVKDYAIYGNYSTSLLYTNSKNELYAVGVNNFGMQVNDGQDFSTPYKVFDNVVKFSDCFILTDDGKLYFHSSSLKKPTLIKENISDFINSESYRIYDGNSSNGVRLFIDNNDGTHDSFILYIKDGELITKKQTKLDSKVKKLTENFLLLENGEAYYLSYYIEIDKLKFGLKFIMDDVKDINEHDNKVYLLKNDGKLYYWHSNKASTTENFAKTILKQQKYKSENLYHILNNVESIEMFEPDYFGSSGIIALKDGSILYASDLVKENAIDNSSDKIEVSDVKVNGVDKTIFTVSEELGYAATVIPSNANDKKYKIVSSNPNIVNIDEDGNQRAVGAGKANVCAYMENNPEIKDCVEVEVYPKLSGLEFTNGDSLVLGVYDETPTILTVNLLPVDVLPQEITWITDSNQVELEDYCYKNEDNTWTHDWQKTQVDLPNNQKSIRLLKSGTYTVTASAGEYKKSITIIAKDYANDVKINIPDRYKIRDREYVVGLNKMGTYKLPYTVYPEDSLEKDVYFISTDESIATVDGNGLITFKKTGRVWIEVYLKNEQGGASVCFEVQDKLPDLPSLKGDVTEDGKVDLVDVMYALRISLGLIQNTPDEVIEIGDINGTGEIDLADVMYILRTALNLR